MSRHEELEDLPRETISDEIDLIQLFLILWKRRKFIIVATLLLTIAAASISFVLPEVYSVSAILEPGKDAEGKVFVGPATIRENVLGGTYSQTIAKQLNLPLSEIPFVRVTIPKDTDLVKLSVESPDSQQAVQILDDLLVAISADIQKTLDLEIKKTKNEIRMLKIESDFLHKKERLINDQISQIQSKMAIVDRERKKALAAPESDAMAVLLYSNEIQNQQIYLNGLQVKWAEVLTQKNKIVVDVDNARLKLEGIKGTNINKPPNLPDKPIKPKKVLIVLMVFLLALVGSILFALFAEFMSSVRKRSVQEG